MSRPADPPEPVDRLRLDKWLWRARLAKTRAIAAETIEKGRYRVNARRVTKPGHAIKIGDVLTFAAQGRVRVIEIRDFGARRGPPAEAAALYVDQLDAAGATPGRAPRSRSSNTS